MENMLIDEEKNEGEAVYLFSDEEALENSKTSPLVQAVTRHPLLSNFHFRTTEIVKDASLITRAPIMEAAAA